MSKIIYWVGPIINPEELSKNKAASPAANMWQLNFISALKYLKNEVIVLSHRPARIFPMGRFYIKKQNQEVSLTKVISSPYINVPLLKNFLIIKGLIKGFRKIPSIDIVITYNNGKINIDLARRLKNERNAIWIMIVADGPYGPGPDLYVFLSYGYFLKAPMTNKLHIDGGVSKPALQGSLNQMRNPILLYSGSLSKWTGIEKFVRDFCSIEVNKKFELHIYGRGKSRAIREISRLYSNVILKGFVSTEELHNAFNNATAFINPRPIDILDGEKNFPSKVLHYLQYGKPILSTNPGSFSKSYDEILLFYNAADIKSLENRLVSLRNMSQAEYISLQNKIYTFCSEHTWEMQVTKLLNKLEILESL